MVTENGRQYRLNSENVIQVPGLQCFLNFKVDLTCNLRFSLKNDKSVLQSYS